MQKSSYVKVASYEARKGEVKKVVLLYSGGLDTSVLLKWIAEEYKAQVVALTVDIGQLTDDLEQVRQKALKLGAVSAYVIDAKDEFADEYIAKGIKANAYYQGRYHLSTPIGRPLLAKWAVKIAARGAFRHGTGFIDAKFPSVKVFPVPILNRFCRVRVFHLHEPESARAAGHLVGKNRCGDDGARLRERVAQGVARCSVREIPDIQLDCHSEKKLSANILGEFAKRQIAPSSDRDRPP